MDDISRARFVLVSRLKTKLKAQACGLKLSDGEFHDWADEIVDEAIALAHAESDRWDENKGSFMHWYHLKAQDVLYKELQKRKNFLKVLKRVEEEAQIAPGPKDEFTKRLIRRELYNHLNGLKPSQRKALTMYYLLDIPVSEIGEAMNREPKAVYSLLDRARKKLRQLLGGKKEDYL